MRVENITMKSHTDKSSETTVRFYGLDNLSETGATEKPLLVLCPGGYFTHYSKKEVDPIATAFLSHGYQVAVVYYQLVDGVTKVYPSAAIAVIDTIRYFRKNSTAFKIDKNKIILAGFSAGGHIASAVSAMVLSPTMQEKYDLNSETDLPNAQILGYPFIDFGIVNFEVTKEQQEQIPQEDILHNTATGVTENTPPTFIFHATGDAIVPVRNSTEYFEALLEHGVKTEAHFFNAKVHGFSVATPVIAESGQRDLVDSHLAKWVELAIEFITRTTL